MKLKDVKIGQRFGFEKNATYFGKDKCKVWIRVSKSHIHMDTEPEPEKIEDMDANVYID